MRYILLCFFTVSLFASSLELTSTQIENIAKKIWQNEGSGKDKYLIWWNKGEDFASVGIGHFIWFPKDHEERFREVFPLFLKYLQQHDVRLPYGLTPQSDLPWDTRKAFLQAKKNRTKEYLRLFSFVKSTMNQQAMFMIDRMKTALSMILESIEDSTQKELIASRFNRLMYKKDGSVDEKGVFVLVDYINFKGEGTLESERYKGEGWGLLQVLENMDDTHNMCQAFVTSAKEVLSRRIENSPPLRGEKRWKKGWFARLERYCK